MKQTSTRQSGRRNQIACWVYVSCLAFVVVACPLKLAWAAGPMAEPELLDAERAFSVSARLVDAKTLELHFDIAPGYYMYRDRFGFSINGKRLTMSQKAWPAGKLKHDATFGKVVTYRKSVRLLLAITAINNANAQAGPESITLIARSQGCADVGVCYPPMRQTLVLTSGSSGWVSSRNESSTGFSHVEPSRSEMAERLTSGK